MTEPQQDLQSVHQEYQQFLEGFQSVQLATVDGAGVPEASYAVYIRHENDYYVYVSELARHTRNMLNAGHVSMLFIEDEQQAKNLFARRRATLQCTAAEIPRGSDHFETILDQLEQRFGNFMTLLKSLNDFHLVQITPVSGNYVRGFAQAFNLSGEDLSEIAHSKGA